MIEKGPFVTEYLVALKRTIDLTLNQYSRVFAFRVDLRLPTNGSAPGYACTNAILNRFLESFKAKIKHNRYMARQKINMRTNALLGTFGQGRLVAMIALTITCCFF